MNWVDYVVLAQGIVLLLLGWKLGVIRMVLIGVGVFMGLWITSHADRSVKEPLNQFLHSSTASTIVIDVVVFLGVALVVSLVDSGLRAGLHRVVLGWVDTTGGLAAGIACGFLVGAAIVGLLVAMGTQQAVPSSVASVAPDASSRYQIEQEVQSSKAAAWYRKTDRFLPGPIQEAFPWKFIRAEKA